MENLPICAGSICVGLALGLTVMGFLSLSKKRGANSNYTEFPMDDNNFMGTFKDKGNYD